VAIAEDIAYLACGDYGSFTVIDVVDHDSPLPRGEIATWHSFEGVGVNGSIAYLASGMDGIQVVDISDPASPALLATVDTPSWAYEVSVQGTIAYVADGDGGLRTYSVADPANPHLLDIVDTPGNGFQVTLVGTLAYVADGESGLLIVDAADPGNLATIGEYDTDYVTYDVAVLGDYAYLADNNGGLCVLDVSDPANPAYVGRDLFNGDPIHGIDISEGHAFLACNWGALRVMDLAVPESPQLDLLLSMPGMGYDVQVHGRYCYMSTRADGLYVINAIDPANAEIVGFADTPSYAMRLEVVGDKVYVADQNSGLQIAWIDCDDTTPVFLQHFAVEAAPGAVSVRWEVSAGSDAADFRLEASGGQSRWQVPFAEAPAGIFSALDRSAEVAAGGRVTYSLFANEGDGFWQLLRSESVAVDPMPRATRIAGAWPNPFNPRVTLRFELAAAGAARLAIYDIGGREMAVLANGTLAGGPHEFVWDGRDAAGRELASGLYVARLVSAGGEDTQRLVLAR
jgi:hypothetical protein